MELFHTGFFHLTVCLEDSSRSFHGLVAQLFFITEHCFIFWMFEFVSALIEGYFGC